MKTHRIFADLLFSNDGPPQRGVSIVIGESGRILEIMQVASPLEGDTCLGVVAPGLVNAHGHLELSQLKGLIADDARGMTHFITKMMAFRQSPGFAMEESSMKEADRSMAEEGVVAAGDVSNTRSSIMVKAKSSIRYHTFVEVMGLSGERAAGIWRAGEELKREFEAVLGPGSASITPHALYSVSKRLMSSILSAHPTLAPLSIHMQESPDERDYCKDKTGPLAVLFEKNGITDHDFIPYGKESPLLNFLKDVSPEVRVQTVHNTFTDSVEIEQAVQYAQNHFWCLCPSANLFITGRLPDVYGLVHSGAGITVGTDSLASNDRLSMVKELSLLQEHFPGLATEDLLRWATLEGARFLGFEQELGRVIPGKSPGLVVFENMNPENPRFHKEVKARKWKVE